MNINHHNQSFINHSFITTLLILMYCIIPQTQTACGYDNARCDPRCYNYYCDQALAFTANQRCCSGYGCNANYLSTMYYLWPDTHTCNSYCQPHYYQSTYSNFGTQGICTICDSRCYQCSAAGNTNCITCSTTSYQLNASTCYQQTNVPYNPCPAPYYGLQVTKKCQKCPTGCASCNIYLQWQMPGTYATNHKMSNTNCTEDPLCLYTLKCYTCNSGYALEQFSCITTQRCRKYSLRNATGIFAPSQCYCMDNFYQTGLSSCSRCSISCLKCTSGTTCTKCPDGGALASGSCSYNLTFQQIENWGTGNNYWGTSATFAGSLGTWTRTPSGGGTSNPQSCPHQKYTFGYYDVVVNNNPTLYAGLPNDILVTTFPTNAQLKYDSAGGYGTNHYGLKIRAALLFIDKWTNDLSIIVRQGNPLIDRFAFFYQMSDVIGQYYCGLNYHDHHDVMDDWFYHNTDGVHISMKASKENYAWGIRQVIIYKLNCDDSCLTCNGPLETNCLTCSYANQVVVNGDCVCNVNSGTGYYNNSDPISPSCVLDCTPKFRDNLTRSCISTCVWPLDFHLTRNSLTSCQSDCPSPYYKMYNDPTLLRNQCVLNCYNTSITDDTLNYYKWDGIDKVCYNDCPIGTYGDPVSKSCVTQCPKTSTTDQSGYFALNQHCSQYCPQSTGKFAFPGQYYNAGVRVQGTRQCLSTCPNGYYKNFKTVGGIKMQLCQEICTVTLSGQKKFGDNSTGWCVDICPTGTFADNATNLCLSICNNTSYRQQVLNTSDSTTYRTCQIYCASALPYDRFGHPFTRDCVPPTSCPNNYFGDTHTTFCQQLCTNSLQFGDNTTKRCQTTCTTGFKQNHTKICVATCPVNDTNGHPEYGDPVSKYCISQCQGAYFADNQTNRQCVLTCAATPAQTYGQNFMCVFNCSSSTWADPFHANRKCVPSCTYNPVGFKSYGYNSTRKCVAQCPDTQYGNYINSVPYCVFTCDADTVHGTYGSFGNPLNNLCVPQCPPPYYGDQDISSNRLCVKDCPIYGTTIWFALNVTAAGVPSNDRICVTSCPYGWADNFTRTCATLSTGCSQGLFAHQTNHKCVIETDCTGYGDPISRHCVPICFSNSTHLYFADPSTKMCVLKCPQVPDYYGDNHTQTCVDTCNLAAQQMRDFQNDRRCVAKQNCSRSPLALFGDYVDWTCVTAKNCTTNYYGDNYTMLCQLDCQGSILLYSDPQSRECVSVCQMDYWALNTSVNIGVCSRFCPIPQWADNLTVQCTTQCSSNTYGVNYTQAVAPTSYGVCQSQCPINQFARDIDNLCVTNCGIDHWGVQQTRKCVTSPYDCPQSYYADNDTHMCVLSVDCSLVSTVQYVADNRSKQCLPGCPNDIHNFADLDKKLCVAVCPWNKYGDNNTLECHDQCKDSSNQYHGQYADPQLRICVQICSAAPIATFGENITFKCVQAKYCPAQTWAQIQVYNRQCVPFCPAPNIRNSNPRKWADNITKTCVITCPTYFFGDLSDGYGMCVSTCPSLSNGRLQFSNNNTKTCVQICPLVDNLWGDKVSLSCVLKCPLNWFAQQVPDRYCQQVCSLGTWGNQITRICVTTPFGCPTINGSKYYADNTTTMCVKTCPQPTYNLWGQNSTRYCVATCLTGFKYNLTRVCIDICPQQLDQQGSYSDQGMCYYVCMTPNYYRDPQNARSCQPDCSFSPIQSYRDDVTWSCVQTCPTFPKYYYAYDGNKTCLQVCPLSSMKDPSTRKCVQSCPTGSFFDPNSDQCLENCPFDYSNNIRYYGDPSLAIPTCVANSSCSSGYYADDYVGLCVQTCSQNQWKHQKDCVTFCPDGYYGNYDTGFCVVPSGCPTDHYAQNQTVTCVSTCNGTFADTNAKKCVNICPTSYYADPATRKCALTCTSNSSITLHKNSENQTCVSSCSAQMFLNPSNNKCQSSCADPLYADPTTHLCVTVCPSVPQLYGQNDTNYCVQDCNNTLNQFRYIAGRVCVTSCPNGYFRQNFTRYCVRQCLNNSYADSTSKYCVSNCTPKYSFDDPNQCLSACPIPYYKDTTTYKCVLQCPTNPVRYYKVVTSTDRRCDTNCPPGQYRDTLSYSCVTLCPPSPPTYADPTSGNCVSVCPTLYSQPLTRTCVSKCPTNQYIQNTTRTCVSQCPNGTDTYGDGSLATPACVYLCSSGYFSDLYTLTCVSQCRSTPKKMYGFDNGTSRICLQSCPYPYIADNTTKKCQIQCNNPTLPYLDKASKSCVSICTSQVYLFSFMPKGQTVNGQCVKFCPNDYYALLTNNSCVPDKCPPDFYADIQNNTCYDNCTLANNRFADPTTNLCVGTCPVDATDPLKDYFRDLFTRTCVNVCPIDKQTYKDNNTRNCQPRCTVDTQYADPSSGYCVDSCPSTPSLFADPITQTCVQNCSLYILRYVYLVNRTCVTQCPSGLYADDSTRTCVVASDCPSGFWGLNSSRVCVDVCPTSPDLFGDQVTKTCVSLCQSTYYADFTTRECVKVCPTIPALFSENLTRVCVSQCPNNSYADNYTRRCIAICSIASLQTFADNTTNRCVSTCPTQPNYFASNKTWQCVKLCPSSPPMWADYSTRRCVQDCPGGPIDTYADNSTRFCVKTCPGSTFMENTTRECVTSCITGYADPQTKFCIAKCPNYTYGHNSTKTCVTICPNQTPQLYAQDGNNICMKDCLLTFNTYADSSTKRCVKICPISTGFFALNATRTCVPTCPSSPPRFADNSTRYCVPVCPSIPSLYALNNSTRVCSANCDANTWADNQTRSCVTLCPINSSVQTYGDNSTWSCVSKCPTKPMRYSDNSTHLCVITCPPFPDYYAQNLTQRCVYNCSQDTYADSTTRKCVQTCPQTWFGNNNTYRCVQTCPSGQFADDLLNLCVSKCSVDPIYYGNPDTHICVVQCPSSNYSFGNPLTQQCVKYNLVTGFSGCPDTYFSDNLTRLCVQVCPMKQDTYGDNYTWKCVSKCPTGSVHNISLPGTFSDNSTMRCVVTCPQYPQYYAQVYSRRCVSLCLAANSTYTGSFADNSTRQCVQHCPSTPSYYSDNSTRRCVKYCPHDPLTFADNSTRRCVSVCPKTPDYYGQITTRTCVSMCPQSQLTYADNSTRLCVKTCPSSPQSLFAQNITNVCVKNCPSGSFADNSSRVCVARCPQYPDTYGDPSTNKCVSICPSNPDLYADPLSKQCVTRCPDGYYAENNTRRCLPQCPMNLVNYADNVTNRCVAKCPQNSAQPYYTKYNTYGDNSTRKCVTQCPRVPETYAHNYTRMCLKICTNDTAGGYGQNNTLICVQTCPDDSFGDPVTRYCIRYCNVGWFAYIVTNMCVQNCPYPYFADNSTWECVLKCPSSQLLFGSSFDRTCTPMCPNGTYADQWSQQCVANCPGLTQDTYALQPDRKCVKQCPIPLYAYPVTYQCIAVCINPYYENITDHRCWKCPDQCSQCNYPQLCITCIPNHFLYSGACMQSCPTFPAITYANPNGVCGTSFQCTSGYFALNSTKSCVQTCPEGYFKNDAQQTCQSCLKGCLLCTNKTSCLKCNDTISIWNNYNCYTYCSPLRKYYTDTGCARECPQGTYLDLTTCKACSSLCKKCVVQPQNCLTCANGLYLQNNLCIEKCPDGTKPVLDGQLLSCVSCNVVNCNNATTTDSTGSTVTLPPLNYSTQVYVENYQYKIRLKFNQQVNFTDNLDKIFKVMQFKSSNTSRLLQNVYDYLDYTIIVYDNGQIQFVLKNYDPNVNGDLTFQVQIIKPEAIISASGDLPQNTRVSVSVAKQNYYQITDLNNHMVNYTNVVIIFLCLMLLFTFWTEQSIWMPLFDYLQMVFVLFFINIILPPSPTYVLGSFRYSFLTWLPNIFTSVIPKARINSGINFSILSVLGDLIFLRSLGYIFLLLIVLIIVLIIIFIFSKKMPQFMKEYGLKKWAKKFIKQTFWKKHLHGLIYFFILPVFLFAVMGIRQYSLSSYEYKNYAIVGFSIFTSWVLVLIFLIVFIVFIYQIQKFLRNNQATYMSLRKAYHYITEKCQVVLIKNKQLYYTFDSSNSNKRQIDLTILSQPRINDKLFLPYPLETNISPWSISFPLLMYSFKILVCIFMIASVNNPIVQVFLLTFLEIVLIIFVAVLKPYTEFTYSSSYLSHKQQTKEDPSNPNNSNLCPTLSMTACIKFFTKVNNNIIINNILHLISNVIIIAFILKYNDISQSERILIGNILCGVILFGLTFNLLIFLHKTKEWYYQYLWKWFIKTDLFRENYTVQHLQLTHQYQKIEKQMKNKAANRDQLIEASKVQQLDGLAQFASTNVKTKDKKAKPVNLRPSQTQVLKKQITDMFQTIGGQKQFSHKSIRSSQRLSRNDRNKVRDAIFGEGKDLKQQHKNFDDLKEYQQMNRIPQQQSVIDDQTQYQYEYVEQEYPEGTDLNQILKSAKKGDIIMP